MKTLMRFAASLLLVAFFFGLITLPGSCFSLAAGSRNQKEQQTKVKNIKAKRGPEVASRVKKLRKSNKSVRAALRLFESRGRIPKFEAAESISGTMSSTDVASNKSRKNLSAFQKIAFAPQSETIDGEGYELITIPTLDVVGEWQGTFIATKIRRVR